MRRAWLVVVLALVGCSDAPSRSDCARATAKMMMFEDLASLAGDEEIVDQIGDEVGNYTEREAWSVLKSLDAGRVNGNPHEALDRVKDCEQRGKQSQVDCVLGATSGRALKACGLARRKRD